MQSACAVKIYEIRRAVWCLAAYGYLCFPECVARASKACSRSRRGSRHRPVSFRRNVVSILSSAPSLSSANPGSTYASARFLMVLRAHFLMLCLVRERIGFPTRPSMPSCSRRSRTLRAAGAVARRRAILDNRCARRHRLRTGRDGRMVPIERKDGTTVALMPPDFPLPLPVRCRAFGKRKCQPAIIAVDGIWTALSAA